jgi:hypothetical protein
MLVAYQPHDEHVRVCSKRKYAAPLLSVVTFGK